MADLRRMFYNRYKTSSIFNTETSTMNNYPRREIITRNDNFIPKYNYMTSKERYWHEMRYKDFGHSNIIKNKNYNTIINKINNNSPSKSIKRNRSIKNMRRYKSFNKINNLKATDIMCRHMYRGYDPMEYKSKRSKSQYDLRSSLSNLSINDISSRQERNLAYTGSNIFFDKSKDIQIHKSYIKYKKNSNSRNNKNKFSKIIRQEKSLTDLESQLNERRPKYTHSRLSTDMDWKLTNYENIYFDTESNYIPSLTDSGIKQKNFRRVNILRREMNGDLKYKNKNTNQNKESVKYNLLSGRDKKNELSTKVYNKYNNNNNQKKNFSRKKYYYNIEKNRNKYNPTVEYYEIDIPRNYDLTDINTIRNFFTSKGIHAFKIEESSNSINNQSGKIRLRIRKDNIVDEKEYNKNINNIKKLISKNDMKLYRIEGNKAIASTIAKQRVKTPYKGEVILKPVDTKNEYKSNKVKKSNVSKNSNKVKGLSITKGNKVLSKKDKNDIKTKK